MILPTHPPWGGLPIGVVIPLLGALVTTPLPIVVLPGVLSGHALQVPVGGVESGVALPDAAAQVVVVILVHAKLQVRVAVKVLTLSWVGGDGAGEEGGGGREERSCIIQDHA